MSSAASARWVLAVLLLGVLIGALDIAIVGPALPDLGAAFGVDERSLSWVVGIFVLFNLIGAPALAKLSDRVGRQRSYTLCLGLFVAGSTIVAFAPSFAVLLFGRAVQGIGAGGIFPVASAVVADLFPAERRGRVLGLIGAVFGLAFVLGPVLGGLLLPIGWHWLFLINVPIGLVLIVVAGRVLPRATVERRGRFDGIGVMLLAGALLLIGFGLNGVDAERGIEGLLALRVWPCLLAGLSLYAALNRIEGRASDPVLPPAMWRGQLRLIASIAVIAGIVEAAMVFLPAMAVVSFGVTPATASFMLLPLVAALIVGAPSAGILLDHVGARPVIQVGICLIGIGLLVFGIGGVVRSTFYGAGGLIGLGLASLIGAPLRHAALREVGPEDRGASQGWLTLHLGSGQLIGAALIGGIVASSAGGGVAGFQRAMLTLACGCAVGLLLSTGLRGGKTIELGEPEARS